MIAARSARKDKYDHLRTYATIPITVMLARTEAARAVACRLYTSTVAFQAKAAICPQRLYGDAKVAHESCSSSIPAL
jgi:hypothetical protein